MKAVGKWLTVSSISNGTEKILYRAFQEDGRDCHLQIEGYRIDISDQWREEKGVLHMRTVISGERLDSTAGGRKTGIGISVGIPVEGAGSRLRAGVPSAVYDGIVDEAHREYHSFMEDRLTGPLIILYDEKSGETAAIRKRNSASLSEPEKRERGEGRFLHRTDVVSLGYGYDETPYFVMRFPYEEKEKSAALDARQTPAEAFYPLDEDRFSYVLEYELAFRRYESFTEALYEEYKELAGEKAKQGEKTAVLPFTRQQEIEFRKQGAAKTYREFGEKGAGYFFHFDPRKGYGSAPTGFGSSFNTIPHETYTHILEYGFTGRQIDIALTLAKCGRENMKRGEKVIDFFVNECICKDGWVYSLYDLEQKRPFASFGDAEAPRLHYMAYGDEEGNYLRTMTEPVFDLLKAYRWYRGQGQDKRQWIDAVHTYASFLLKKQNKDGSWYRAYTKAGNPVFMNEDESQTDKEREQGRKGSTMIPVPFLCELAQEDGQDTRYRDAAVQAGNYTLNHELRQELYRGGTMDNPNIVDKEAAQYAMAGMYSLYQLTGEEKYIRAAGKAARQFVTWNYIWNAPMRKGTILQKKGFCTKGMGAINSVWCAGVVDIYSLFHIRELYLTGRAIGEEFMEEMAEWISTAGHQILSWPGDDMGFADVGMQPEGFGICAQGMDEGMIRKGDIWGTLGWIYSAGIGGMERYLECTEEKVQ